jgi:hypothetical protein
MDVPQPEWVTSEHMTGVSCGCFVFLFLFPVASSCSSDPIHLAQIPQILLQTSIMAVEFAGGVVIGADSRTTTG